MKKGGVLHPELAGYLARLGHGDRILIADAGLPIPSSIPRVDLAFYPGKPSFFDVFVAIMEENKFQEIIMTRETGDKSPRFSSQLNAEVNRIFGNDYRRNIVKVSHTELKAMSSLVYFAVRTGEFTPYANVILTSGVAF